MVLFMVYDWMVGMKINKQFLLSLEVFKVMDNELFWLDDYAFD